MQGIAGCSRPVKHRALTVNYGLWMSGTPEVQSTRAGSSRAMREEGGKADGVVTADAAGSGEVRNGRSSEEPRTVVVTTSPAPVSRMSELRSSGWLASRSTEIRSAARQAKMAIT